MSAESDVQDDPKIVNPPTTKTAESADDIESMSEDDLRDNLRRSRKALKEKNAESQKQREKMARLQEIEEEEERRKQAQLTELEKLQRKVAEQERLASERAEESKRYKDELLRVRLAREVEEEARKLGFDFPQQAAEMLRGRANNGVDYDPDGDRFIGARDAVKKLLSDYPNLASGGMKANRGTPPREKASQSRGQEQEVSQSEIDRLALISAVKGNYQSF